MEGKRVRSSVVMLMIVGVLMGMFVGQTSASFKSCYKECFFKCLSPATCMFKCIHHNSPSNDNYCQLGCVSSKCANISTPQDPRVEEVEACVNSCNKCTKWY